MLACARVRETPGFKRPMPVIRVLGGGAISDLWCQIHADILERRIEQVVAIIGSLLVLALFLTTTGVSLGLIEGTAVYAAVGAVMFFLARKTFS